MATNTPNYDFILPAVNNPVDEDLWGDELNDNFTSLDSLLLTATNIVKRTVATTDSATITDQNKILLGDATVASYVQTLPDASDVGDGFVISFVKTDATAHTISVTPAGSDTIGSAASAYVLNSQNDALTLIGDGVSNWNYQIKTPSDSSTTIKGITRYATVLETETGTDTASATTPAGVAGALSTNIATAKAWAFISVSGVINKGYNVASATLGSPGVITVNFTTPMSDTNYAVNVTMGVSDFPDGTNASFILEKYTVRTTSSCTILTGVAGTAVNAPLSITVFD